MASKRRGIGRRRGGLARFRPGVFSTGQGLAYQLWDDWRTPTSGPLNLVRAAILAANPHNSQPWLFHVTQTQIDLFSDRRRTLGTVDPFLFEMHIGLGCLPTRIIVQIPPWSSKDIVRSRRTTRHGIESEATKCSFSPGVPDEFTPKAL